MGFLDLLNSALLDVFSNAQKAYRSLKLLTDDADNALYLKERGISKNLVNYAETLEAMAASETDSDFKDELNAEAIGVRIFAKNFL